MTSTVNDITLGGILGFIERFIDVNGYSPSVREVQDAFGIGSSSTANEWLRRLEDGGFIKRVPGIPRSIAIIHD